MKKIEPREYPPILYAKNSAQILHQVSLKKKAVIYKKQQRAQQSHRSLTVEQNKKCFDDKRYLLADGIQCYAHEHYRIVILLGVPEWGSHPLRGG